MGRAGVLSNQLKSARLAAYIAHKAMLGELFHRAAGGARAKGTHACAERGEWGMSRRDSARAAPLGDVPNMSDFRRLSDAVMASPQIAPGDLAEAQTCAVALIINNRPDGEDPSAPLGEEIARAAAAIGIDYLAIPIGPAGFGEADIAAMAAAMESAPGPILAYCRSGTRSTFLWALASARLGGDPEAITGAARAAGYDISPIRPMLDRFAAQ